VGTGTANLVVCPCNVQFGSKFNAIRPQPSDLFENSHADSFDLRKVQTCTTKNNTTPRRPPRQSEVQVKKSHKFKNLKNILQLEGHSIERIYLRQRSSDGSVNKKPLQSHGSL